MCGIAGMVSMHSPIDDAGLKRMADALIHRGPDAWGMQVWSDPVHVGLAHRRLSIIDLSDAAVQPMCNEDESIWISFNGEFYNFADYRDELEAKGHVFKSHSDTETILHLYEEYGFEETLKRMNGMFAFALWDQRLQKLYLARDRMGQKPLYYRQLDDGSLHFASEIKALLEVGPTPEIDTQGLSDFWRLDTSRASARFIRGFSSCRRGGLLSGPRELSIIRRIGSSPFCTIRFTSVRWKI